MITNLVIGSEGFIGKPFCQYLESLGEKVVRFDIKRSKKEDARSFKFNFDKIDRVYFLAWEVGGSKYLYKKNTQLDQLGWNLKLLMNVMPQLEKQKVKFMFASSQLSEEATVYGATKRLGEIWTELIGGVSVRIWNAYGVLEEHNVRSHVISDFVYQAVKFKKIKMLSDGEEWRQFTHVDDLARAFHASLASRDLKRSVYDASSYHWVQIKEVAEIVCKLTGAKFIVGKKKANTPTAFNMGRLPSWLPAVSLREGIRRMVQQVHGSFS